jgi:hypothetical protein
VSKPWKTRITVPSEVRGWGENKRTLPALDVHLEIAIDWQRIAQHFGEKAARSKGKRSVALGGKIKIKAVKVAEVQA